MPTYLNNREETLFPSAAYTASQNSDDQTNLGAKGVIVTIDVTVLTAGASIVFTIAYKDSLSGKYATLGTSAAVTATGTTSLLCYPGATAAANTIFNRSVPAVWRLQAVAADSKSVTYSASANYIL